MALTITVVELLAALRLGNTDEETAEATRLLGYATKAIEKYLGSTFDSTPETIVNEAAIRVAGYLFDAPFAARADTVANSMRSSGAAYMLLPYLVHRAGTTGAAVDAAQAAVGSSGNPVTDVSVEDGNLVVTFAAGTTETIPLPAGGSSVATNVADGRLPAPAVAARLGWSQTRDVNAGVFTRADDHPEDGAAVGTSDGVEAPPFPPALNSDSSLYLHWWVAGAVAVAAFLEGIGVDPVDYTNLFEGVGDLTIDGEVGTVYISTFRLSPLAGSIFRAVLPGALILTDDAVEDWAKTSDDTPIPADKLSLATSWYWVATASSAFVANTPKTASLRTFPIGPWADYTSLQAAVAGGSIKTIAVHFSQNTDGDHGTVMTPNIDGFREGVSLFDAHPGHPLSVDPARFRVNFGTTELTVEADVAVPASPTVVLRLGVQI